MTSTFDLPADSSAAQAHQHVVLQLLAASFAGGSIVRTGLSQHWGSILRKNPTDPLHRRMNYPAVWLLIVEAFRMNEEENFSLFCFGMIFAFFACASRRLYRFPYRFPSPIFLLGLLLSSTMLAIERGNNNLLIFVLLYFVFDSDRYIQLLKQTPDRTSEQGLLYCFLFCCGKAYPARAM
jgi:hypothetical protein